MRLTEIVTARPASNAPAAVISSTPSSPVASTNTHTRANPYLAPVVDKRPLTHEVSSKLTLHMAFAIDDSALKYEAGDAGGIIPQNNMNLVEEILHTLNFSPQVPVQLPHAGATTLVDALFNHLQITGLTRKMIEAYATIGQCHNLARLLIPEQQSHLEKYTYNRALIDLLHDYPGVLLDPADFVAMLPKLAPRLYSISSSPLAPRRCSRTTPVHRAHAHPRTHCLHAQHLGHHLGRPAYAWRVLKMWRRSWLSREVLLFGLFFCALTVLTAASWLNALHMLPFATVILLALKLLAPMLGIAGILTSAFIYLVPARPAWNTPHTPLDFLLSSALLGSAAAPLLISATATLRALPALQPFVPCPIY
jgi:hypothetical protein